MPPHYPMPMMPGVIMMDRPPEKTLLTIVPARVHMAMSVLNYATDKIRPQIMSNGMTQTDTATEPLELDVEEIKLMRTAANTVESYLKGELVLTPEEKKVMDDTTDKRKGPGSLLRCVNCGGSRIIRGMRCGVCNGLGAIMCFPATPEPRDEDNEP